MLCRSINTPEKATRVCVNLPESRTRVTNLLVSDHPEVAERIHDGLFLFRRADVTATVFGLGLVITLAYFQAALLLDLGNVEG